MNEALIYQEHNRRFSERDPLMQRHEHLEI